MATASGFPATRLAQPPRIVIREAPRLIRRDVHVDEPELFVANARVGLGKAPAALAQALDLGIVARQHRDPRLTVGAAAVVLAGRERAADAAVTEHQPCFRARKRHNGMGVVATVEEEKAAFLAVERGERVHQPAADPGETALGALGETG